MERAVGKNEKLESFKLGRAKRSWEELIEVGKFELKLEVGVPTSLGSFQLRLALSNFSETFQLQTSILKNFQLLVLSNCPFQLHASREYAIKIGVFNEKMTVYGLLRNYNTFKLSEFPKIEILNKTKV